MHEPAVQELCCHVTATTTRKYGTVVTPAGCVPTQFPTAADASDGSALGCQQRPTYQFCWYTVPPTVTGRGSVGSGASAPDVDPFGREGPSASTASAKTARTLLCATVSCA